MNNFGVVELAGHRRAVAPGWAYVPDSRNNALLPPGFGGAAGAGAAARQLDALGAAGAAQDAAKPRKRAARSQAAGPAGNSLALFSDLTSRQETKLRKELEVLNRDMGAPAGSGVAARDAAIPIPARAVKAQNRYTPNVRKILASQKTFANHLDDFNAFNALHGTTQGHLNHGMVNDAAAAAKTASAAASASAPSSSRRPARKDSKAEREREKEKDTKDTKSARTARRSAASRRSTSTAKVEAEAVEAPAPAPAEDAPMADADDGDAGHSSEKTAKEQDKDGATGPVSAILRPYDGPKPPAHPLDRDPLLASAVPPVPSDDVLRALVAGPPLPYPEARATLAHPTAMGGSSGHPYPARVFCEICGYWGRVKCTKCGTPVCALDCLELHRQDCITRYGL